MQQNIKDVNNIYLKTNNNYYLEKIKKKYI